VQTSVGATEIRTATEPIERKRGTDEEERVGAVSGAIGGARLCEGKRVCEPWNSGLPLFPGACKSVALFVYMGMGKDPHSPANVCRGQCCALVLSCVVCVRACACVARARGSVKRKKSVRVQRPVERVLSGLWYRTVWSGDNAEVVELGQFGCELSVPERVWLLSVEVGAGAEECFGAVPEPVGGVAFLNHAVHAEGCVVDKVEGA